MSTIDSKKLTEEFMKENNIIPTKMEKILIELAIVKGAKEQISLLRTEGNILV